MVALRQRGRRSAAGLALAVAAGSAASHGFGQRFDLPLPLWLWLTGAAATLVLTFAAIGFFARARGLSESYPRIDLLRVGALRALAHPGVVTLLRSLASALFVLTLAAGFFGSQSPYSNLIPTMIWVVWWVGTAFLCALVGDVWALFDPLRSIFSAAEWVYARASGGRPLARRLAYPARLAQWPAVLLFLGFAWAELVWAGKDVPAQLAAAVLGYAALTWLGMWLFGREVWLRNGEAFAIAFGVLARFAPLAYVAAPTPRLELRPPGAGLMRERTVSWSMLVFVLCMLATVCFDGFKEIPPMQRLDTAIHAVRPLALLLFELSEWGIDESQAVASVVLIAFPFAFVAIFWIANRLVLVAAGPRGARSPSAASAGELARSFVLTLVPIAVAYHLSHYASLLLTAGQFIIPLASDPFGRGWNLFGTAGYQVDLALVSPYVFWYGAVAIIVVGHVIAVWLAHLTALRLFGTHRQALTSQVPMLALMVAYTTLSLWILAQPIVG